MGKTLLSPQRQMAGSGNISIIDLSLAAAKSFGV